MFKYIALTLALLLALSACSHPPRTVPAAERGKFAKELLQGSEACFLLYNLKTHDFEQVINKASCYERTAACSTFKVPLSLMAIDSGLVKDEATPFTWDGKERAMPAWNKNQTAASWMRESVVWVSQELVAKIGRKKVQSYLRKFVFGNRDFSGDLDGAWLTPTPSSEVKPHTSLKVSPFEQIEFWEKLWTNDLPVSDSTMELARKLTFLNESHGFKLNGKTGSGRAGAGYAYRLSWFVAHVQGNGQEYLAVTRLKEKKESPESAAPAGPMAKEITLKLLEAHGLW